MIRRGSLYIPKEYHKSFHSHRLSMTFLEIVSRSSYLKKPWMLLVSSKVGEKTYLILGFRHLWFFLLDFLRVWINSWVFKVRNFLYRHRWRFWWFFVIILMVYREWQFYLIFYSYLYLALYLWSEFWGLSFGQGVLLASGSQALHLDWWGSEYLIYHQEWQASLLSGWSILVWYHFMVPVHRGTFFLRLPHKLVPSEAQRSYLRVSPGEYIMLLIVYWHYWAPMQDHWVLRMVPLDTSHRLWWVFD